MPLNTSLALSFGGLTDVTLEAAITAVALLGTVTAWMVDKFFWRRKRLAYRVQLNVPFGVTPSTNVVDVRFQNGSTGTPYRTRASCCSAWRMPVA